MFASIALFCLFFFQSTMTTPASQPTPTPTPVTDPPDDEVLRIDTALAQTGVTVIDKNGKIVSNLTKDDFELEANGKVIPIEFFENRIIESASAKLSPNEKSTGGAANSKDSFKPSQPGRIIIFIVDDLHLSADSTARTRKMIQSFIKNEKQPDDLVAIVSSTGKIGFLQQFSNNDIMLNAAAERLVYNRDYSATDPQPPPMKEIEAILISRFDPAVTEKFVQAVIAMIPGTLPDVARDLVRERARTVLFQASTINRRIYDALDQSIRALGALPGRKTVVLVSDGFFLDTVNSDSLNRMQKVIDASVRNNAVIYSLDARGLEADLPEGTAASISVQSSERFEKGDGMYYFAEGTGGKFITNTNDMKAGVADILEDSSNYYLIAWQPELESDEPDKFRKIKIKIKNRPELKVRTHSGYLTASSEKTDVKTSKSVNRETAAEKNAIPESEQKLNSALAAQMPVRTLPTSLAVNYLNVPTDGATVAGIIKVDGGSVDIANDAGKASASVDLAGAIFDADGKRQDYFRKLLTIDAKSSDTQKAPADFYYDFQNKLKPGLYQIRVAARDARSGRTGSAVQWIEIPDLTKNKLASSSLILSERNDQSIQKDSTTDAAISVDRRFDRSSVLRYLVFIYNAQIPKNSDKPQVTVTVNLRRDRQTVFTNPNAKVSADPQNAQNLFYGAEIPLRSLQAGKYNLSLTIHDHNAKTEIVRSTGFEIK